MGVGEFLRQIGDERLVHADLLEGATMSIEGGDDLRLERRQSGRAVGSAPGVALIVGGVGLPLFLRGRRRWCKTLVFWAPALLVA